MCFNERFTHSLMMCGCLKSLRFWISRLILPTTSRLRIFCLLRIFTATLWPVSWCSPTVNQTHTHISMKTQLKHHHQQFDIVNTADESFFLFQRKQALVQQAGDLQHKPSKKTKNQRRFSFQVWAFHSNKQNLIYSEFGPYPLA